MITAINPATGEMLEKYEETTPNEVMRRLEKAHHAFQAWKQTSFSERAASMKEASRVLVESQSEYAQTMALEMGKPVTQGRAEIEKCAWVCEYYAEHAEKMLQPEITKTDARKSYVTFNPLGVILAVMPWNYPFWQVFRHAAPGLMSGNGVILKHASKPYTGRRRSG
jgi:succinate-semialdehyde dehydrogenase/glutarate-semialdehyde dehydrogenase